MRFPNDEGSQFSKLHFPCNKEERLVLNSFFREYNLYLKKKQKNFKPVEGSLSSSQLFVTSPHYIYSLLKEMLDKTRRWCFSLMRIS